MSKLTLVILFLIFSNNLKADSPAEESLFLCSGVWTTKACQNAEKSLKLSTKGESGFPSLKSRKAKESLLHPLRMKVLEIKDKFNKSYEYAETETACHNLEVDLDTCKKLVMTDLEKIRLYELDLEKLDLERQQIKQEPKEEEKENIVIINQVTTNIRQHNNILVPPEARKKTSNELPKKFLQKTQPKSSISKETLD